MEGASLFSQPYLCMQPPLQSLSKSFHSTSVNFNFPIPPLLFNKKILKIPADTPFLYTAALFTSMFLRTTIPAIYTKNFFPTSAI